MRSSHSRSRSRGHRGSRKSPDRNYNKRSASRSGSRGRKSGGDPGKRRSKFSDPSGPGSMGGSSRGFSGGFHEDQDPYQNRGGYGGRPQNGGYGQQRYEEPSGYQGNQQHQQGGNGGVFSYNNVRQSNAYDDFDIDKAVQIQKPDASFGRSAPGQGGFDPQENIDQYVSTTGVSSLRQGTKIQRKVFIPQDGKFNYIGLIIGPKGSNQKQLEEQTHCKILIRGKGSQKVGAPIQGDENEDLHVLIEADNEVNVTKAMREIESIIFMEDDEKMKKRDSQLRSAQIGGGHFNDFNQQADNSASIQVPNNCVGLVIGKKGETIRQIKERSGAEKVYMQSEAQRNFNEEFQNLIVEGSAQAVEKCRELIEEIKGQQRQKYGGGRNQNEIRVEMDIPPNMAGLVIGKQGSTLQQVSQQTRTRCSIQQDPTQQDPRKVLIILGNSEEDCKMAKEIFQEKIEQRTTAMTRGFPEQGFQRGGGMHGGMGGGYQGSGYQGGARSNGRPGGFGGGRKPRKNADGDEIVDNVNMYDYVPGYPPDPMMAQNPYMGMPQMYPPQYPGYALPQSLPNQNKDQLPYQQDPQQQLQPSQPQYAPPRPDDQSAPQLHENPADQPQQLSDPTQQPPYGQQYDPVQLQQLQLQMQYQQYYYQQMLMQNQTPVIEEVLPDGTIVSTNTAHDDSDNKKGKRGGRR